MIELPEKCLRNEPLCKPYSQIVSDDNKSYICVGHNAGKLSKTKTDIYTKCVKSESIDSIECCDKRDLTDELSVIAQALSIFGNVLENAQIAIDQFNNAVNKINEELKE